MRGGWRWSLPQSPVLLLVALAGARGEQRAEGLKLQGACPHLNFLNGRVFGRQSQPTASGAPYYKTDPKYGTYYMYYDPNCQGGVDGDPRWIIDADEPSLTATEDLDGDGDCAFLGLVGSGDVNHPPARAVWRLNCENGWEEQEINLTDTTFRDHPTSTATTTTPPPETTTTTTEVPRMLRLEGACGYLDYLNTDIFLLQGTTALGAPFWETMGQHTYYIYFDPDCHGGGINGAPRWIIDNDPPHQERLSDLDGDNDCVYQAHTDSNDKLRPPVSATWSMFCDGGFRDRQITFFEVTTTTTTTTTSTSTSSTTITVTTVTSTSTTTFTSTTKTTTFTTLTTTTQTTTFTTTTATNTTTGTTVTSSSTGTLTTTVTTLTTRTTTTVTMTEADESDEYGKCSDFVCPLGSFPRLNSSSILCAAAECSGADNMTCCEAPTTTPSVTSASVTAEITTTAVPATTEAVDPTSTSTADTTNDTMEVTTMEASTVPSTTTDHHHVATTTPPHAGGHHDAHSGALLLHGVCEFQKNLNGLVFMKIETAASGSPIYKADGEDVYIYWDQHCDGRATTQARWIIDADKPDKTHVSDMDGDQGCHYRAKTLNSDGSAPPLNATWSVYCTGTFQEVRLTLEEAFAIVPSGTCEAAGKVTITDAHACGLAATYLNLTTRTVDPQTMEDAQGQLGCFFDHTSSQLQLVSHSSSDHSQSAGSGSHTTHSGDSSSHSTHSGDSHTTTTHSPDSGSHSHDSHSHNSHGGSHRRLTASNEREALCAGGEMAVHSPEEGAVSGASATAFGWTVAAGLLGLILQWGM